MITVWNRFVQLKGVGKPVQERVQIEAHLVFVFCTCQQVCQDPTPLLFVFSPCQQVCLDPTPVMFVFLSVSTSLPESRPLSRLVSPCQQVCQNPGPSHVCCLCQHLCQDPLLSCLFSVPVNRFASVSASLLKSRPLSCLLSFSVNRFAKIQAPVMSVVFFCQQVCQDPGPCHVCCLFLSTGLPRSRPLSCSVGQRWTR